MKLYFAYGSNLWQKQMKDRCPDHRVIGKGILKGYRWIISTRGYANIVKSDSDEVYGVIYEITDSDEKTLDIKEGVKSGAYQKEMMTIEFNGKNLECLIYIDPIKNEGKPKPEYIERINKGILDAELPPEYIELYMRKFITA